jgi:hypothetical protein
MLKYLRIAVTVLSLMACVLLIGLWVRSHTWGDRFMIPTANHTRLFGVSSYRGWLTIGRGMMDPKSFPKWTVHSNAVAATEEAYASMARDGVKFTRPTPRFGFHGSYFQMPHWPIVVLTGALAAILCIRGERRIKFSLRTLLIGTTLVAVVLGVIVYAAR